MIQLVATDLDCTLLDEQKQVPAGFADTVRKLYEHGIRTAIISGREYYDIVNTEEFAAVQDILLFATDNGALNYAGKKLISANTLTTEEVQPVFQAVCDLPQVNVLLSGEFCGYAIAGRTPELYQDLLRLSGSADKLERIFRFVPDPLKTIGNERIGKLAIYHPSDSDNVTHEALDPFRSRFQIFPSEPQWVNLMKPGVNKGYAVESFQNYLGITPGECMVFGDYLNDCSMFLKAEHTYAVANAHPALKAIAKHIAPPNTEAGVMQTLRQAFDFLNE